MICFFTGERKCAVYAGILAEFLLSIGEKAGVGERRFLLSFD
jgi:hypothetical protein